MAFGTFCRPGVAANLVDSASEQPSLCRKIAFRYVTAKMIRNFSDHSANERTFLAWVRTSIAVMAFGFLVEKFDLFLELSAPSLAGRTLSLPGQKFGNIAGLALIVLGTAMVGIAAARFVMTAKTCAREQDRGSTSHLRGCWSFWAALYSFICRTPLSRSSDGLSKAIRGILQR